MEELIDAKGNSTNWHSDAAWSLARKEISGTTVATYQYSPRTWELAADADANSNRKEYGYFVDDQLKKVHTRCLARVWRRRRM